MAEETVTLTIDGVEVTVPKGTKVIDAAKKVGKVIPHFCYHPGLPVDGNCRMCIADVRTWNARSETHMPARRPAVTCWTDAEENMLVLTDTDEVKKSRATVMEFLLINHPIDCPICDKAGECMLQDYYMQHDQKRSELRDEKVHKPRLVKFGERILYNGERCILCSRCTRFTEHVTKTHELGIVNRGDRAIVEVVAGGDFKNNYTDCVADVCPVGALTKTDFRFKKRVWFLKHTESVCGGCSRNCNTVVDHDGTEIIRIMPRERLGVNDYWMCNEGRDLYKELAATPRPAGHALRAGGAESSAADHVVAWIGERLADKKKSKGEGFAAIGSSWMSNEEAWLLAGLVGKQLKAGAMDVKTDRVDGLPADDLLHTDDHNPNRRGVIDAGVVPGKKDGKDLSAILAACRAGEIDTLLVWGPGLANHVQPKDLAAILTDIDVIQITATADELTAGATAVLSLRNWAESNGTWTNLDGHASRFKKALRPPAHALDGFETLLAIHEAAGIKAPVKNLKEARKKMKQDPDGDAREFANGQFEFPKNQTLYRHTSGVLEV